MGAAGRDAALLPAHRVRDGGRRPATRSAGSTGSTARIARPRPRRGRGGAHGAAYSALDPKLALWVHATLVDSTLRRGDAWLGPLPRDVRARYYAETLPVGRLFGVPEALLPRDVEAFDAYVASMLGPDGPVHPSATARELARAILHPPLGAARCESGPVAARLGGLAVPTAGVLRGDPAGRV